MSSRLLLLWCLCAVLWLSLGCHSPSRRETPEPGEDTHASHAAAHPSPKVNLAHARTTRERLEALRRLHKARRFPHKHRALLLRWWKSPLVALRRSVLRLFHFAPKAIEVRRLFLKALRDPDRGVRGVAMRGLRAFFNLPGGVLSTSSQETLSALLRLLDSPPRPGGAWGRAVVARRVLASLPTPWSLPLMRRYPTLSLRARGHLLTALGHHSHPQIPFFLARALTAGAVSLRRRAANALLLQRYRAVVVLPQLARGLQAKDPWVRGQLLDLVALLGPLARSAAPAVKKLLALQIPADLHAKALLALCRMELSEETLRQPLFQGMKSTSHETRLAAAQCVRATMLRRPRFLRRWSTLLSDPSLLVRTAALQRSLQLSKGPNRRLLLQRVRRLCRQKRGHFARGFCRF